VTWHRRLLAAGLAAGAVAAGLHAVQPAPPPVVTVLAAARDLPAGHPMSAQDVRPSALPPEAAPAAALPAGTDVAGRVLAGPVGAGEPLTAQRFVGPSLLAGYGAGLVGVPVRIADAAAVALVRPGDVVDVLAASGSPLTAEPGVADGDGPRPAAVVASKLQVVAVLGGAAQSAGAGGPGLLSDSGGGFEQGALVLLAAPPSVAAELAGAEAAARLSLALHPTPADRALG
jgi:Flp pilus assembly protein CpaB